MITKMHPNVTLEKLMEMGQRRNTSLDNPGICLTCGEEQEGCEPDARKYKCEHCGDNNVYGEDDLIMMML